MLKTRCKMTVNIPGGASLFFPLNQFSDDAIQLNTSKIAITNKFQLSSQTGELKEYYIEGTHHGGNRNQLIKPFKNCSESRLPARHDRCGLHRRVVVRDSAMRLQFYPHERYFPADSWPIQWLLLWANVDEKNPQQIVWLEAHPNTKFVVFHFA